MPLKIERNDITKMTTEAIVNTAGSTTEVGDGCDVAVYMAAGYDELHKYRIDNIGEVPEGEVFITPGFNLPAKYIIHAVSPLFINGENDEEDKLRACYRKSLWLAMENGIKSIAFPLIGTGSFGYPMVDGLRVAMDEINAFLLDNEMDVTLVVFGTRATKLAEKVYPDLEEYIDHNYVSEKKEEEYGDANFEPIAPYSNDPDLYTRRERISERRQLLSSAVCGAAPMAEPSAKSSSKGSVWKRASKAKEEEVEKTCFSVEAISKDYVLYDEMEESESDEEFDPEKIKERLVHLEDSFGAYTLYLIKSRNMKPVDIQNRAWISKHVFTKINKNPDGYQPSKITAFQLCVGLQLNLDEAKDYIARAGIAFSPSKLDDIIWKYGIEHEADIYDISDILEKYGFPPVVPF